MMVYGKSNYPGLEGFSLTAINGKAVLKSITGITYSLGFFFNLEDEPKIVSAINAGNIGALSSMVCKNRAMLF